jgi:hypothetical protein
MSLRGSRAALFGAGFLIAVVGALCGIGGGLFAVPLLHFLRGLELKRAIATGLVLVAATTGFATAGELMRSEPDLHLEIVWRVALGALFGAQLGFLVVNRIPTNALRVVFAFLLLGAAWRMVLDGSSGEAAPDAADWLSGAHWRAFGAGVAGGFIAPLLGVGGGLLMVPLLFLGIPGMGFGEARATSLAAGFVASVRSLWLHGRARRIDLPAVAPLALGAVGGALVGVQIGHLEGGAHAGRVLLACLLAFVSLRFGYDALRAGLVRRKRTA